MSTGFEEPSFFESIYSGDTVVSATRQPHWETRIPSPKKENQTKWVASPRNHRSLLEPKTVFTAPKTLPKTPMKQDKFFAPLGCVSNGRKLLMADFKNPESPKELFGMIALLNA